MNVKKIISLFIAAIIGFCFCAEIYSVPYPKPTEQTAIGDPDVSAKSAILINAEDGSVYFEKDADKARGMASTTKIMTALVALELCSPDTKVRVPAEAVGVEGSSVYLVEGEVLTLGELLYALMLSSANDAAIAIAVHVSGSVDAFVDRMNERAKDMGLTSTHFVNPHGLYDEDHYTTARELATIAAQALKVKLIRDIVSCTRATISHDGVKDKRLLINHNKLLKIYDGAIGMKTGFTKKTGRTLVSAAERDGLTLIAVTLDAPSDWHDHAAMLDLGFSSYEKRVFFPAESFSYEMPLSDGTKKSVILTNTEPLSLTVRRGVEDAKYTVEGTAHFLVAPVRKGELFGSITLICDGKEISSPLAITESIASRTKPKKSFFERIASFFSLDS